MDLHKQLLTGKIKFAITVILNNNLVVHEQRQTLQKKYIFGLSFNLVWSRWLGYWLSSLLCVSGPRRSRSP